MSGATTETGRSPHSFWIQAEQLWIPALALSIILPAFQLGAAVIRFFGRGGQQETVEWLTYMAALVVFPVAAVVVERVVPRLFSARVALAIRIAFVFFVALEIVYYLARGGWVGIVAALVLSVVTVFFVYKRESSRRVTDSGSIAAIIVGVCAWMSAGSLVSWTDATGWYLTNPARVLIFALALAVSIYSVRAMSHPAVTSDQRAPSRLLSVVGVIVLLGLSFRTNPVLELYHWEAYVGPMQELRQGGWLLWDAPAQYGILPILLPTLLPGNAWQSFYVFQALCNAVVGILMFWALGGFTASRSRILLATLLTAATLFFRPRSATLFLAAQMTPSGGPVRFLWPFVMLAFVYRFYRDPRDERRFLIWGNLIWIAALCWSLESGIYSSAIWFPSLLFLLIRRVVIQRQNGETTRRIARGVLFTTLAPFVALAAIVAVVSLAYRATLGHFPDWMSYAEYALLYSGGFHALPIDPTGSVWYLLIVFLAISTATGIYAFKDVTNLRVMVLAGAWGGVWAISSYFVSRSHAANLLSIATFLVFAIAITLRVLADQPAETWHGLVRAAVVPLFAGPIALTFAHPQFARHITTPQLTYGAFTEQIPLMEPSLNELLVAAGAKPTDPVVRIGDARLMLPAWRPRTPGGPKVISPYSWLPKQYEIIETLPADRRQKYIDRIADHLRLSGWLVHSKTGGIPHFDVQLKDIQRTHVETKHFENKDWIVSWYQLKH
jgi:hypothetical protein